MRKTFILLVGIFILTACSNKEKKESTAANANDELAGEIQLSGAFALYPMAVKWSEVEG